MKPEFDIGDTVKVNFDGIRGLKCYVSYAIESLNHNEIGVDFIFTYYTYKVVCTERIHPEVKEHLEQRDYSDISMTGSRILLIERPL